MSIFLSGDGQRLRPHPVPSAAHSVRKDGKSRGFPSTERPLSPLSEGSHGKSSLLRRLERGREIGLIIQNVRVDEAQAGINIASRNINNLRCKDDTALLAESKEDLKELHDESERGE